MLNGIGPAPRIDIGKSSSAMDIHFHFSAPLWVYSAQSNWHFVTLPQHRAEEIKFFRQLSSYSKVKGFGSIKVSVVSAHNEWRTSIFPDKASQSYLLPIKAAIRKAENWSAGDMINLELRLLLES